METRIVILSLIADLGHHLPAVTTRRQWTSQTVDEHLSICRKLDGQSPAFNPTVGKSVPTTGVNGSVAILNSPWAELI
jgi:hypothetical protein